MRDGINIGDKEFAILERFIEEGSFDYDNAFDYGAGRDGRRRYYGGRNGTDIMLTRYGTEFAVKDLNSLKQPSYPLQRVTLNGNDHKGVGVYSTVASTEVVEAIKEVVKLTV